MSTAAGAGSGTLIPVLVCSTGALTPWISVSGPIKPMIRCRLLTSQRMRTSSARMPMVLSWSLIFCPIRSAIELHTTSRDSVPARCGSLVRKVGSKPVTKGRLSLLRRRCRNYCPMPPSGYGGWMFRPTHAISSTAFARAARRQPTRTSCDAPTSPATPRRSPGFWAAS